MKFRPAFLTLALCVPHCLPLLPSNTGGSSTGGSSTGGSSTGGSSTGGSSKGGSSTGGASTGGASTGGASSVDRFRCPLALLATGGTAAQLPRLSGWRKSPHWDLRLLSDGIVRSSKRAAPVAVSDVIWSPNNAAPLNQKNVSGCVGFGCATIAATRPFARVTSNSDGLRAYQVATRIDNGCPPLGDADCAGAWPTADNGSYSSSGMKAGVALGWWSGWTSAPDVPTLIQHLQRGPCGIGKVWHSAEFEPSTNPATCGRLSQTGPASGGHFAGSVAFIGSASPRRIYIQNSWDGWGACLDGVCGYAYFDEPDLAAEIAAGNAEIVCPTPPAKGN